MTWHQRLGHLNTGAIKELAHNFASGIEIDDLNNKTDCIACLEGKQHKTPFKMGRT